MHHTNRKIAGAGEGEEEGGEDEEFEYILDWRVTITKSYACVVGNTTKRSALTASNTAAVLGAGTEERMKSMAERNK